MKNFVPAKYKESQFYVHRKISGRFRPYPRVLAIDPSWVTGFSIISNTAMKLQVVRRNQKPREKYQVQVFGVIDVRDKRNEPKAETIDKVLRIGKVIDQIIKTFDPRWIAIEQPIVGRAGGAAIGQGRLFQHLIDLSPGIYYKGCSEIHPATAKAAVLQPGDQKKGVKRKERVVQRVEEITKLGLDFGMKRKTDERLYREAVSDSIAVAMAFFKKFQPV